FIVRDRLVSLQRRLERDSSYTAKRVKNTASPGYELANDPVCQRRLQLALIGAERMEAVAPASAVIRMLLVRKRILEFRDQELEFAAGLCALDLDRSSGRVLAKYELDLNEAGLVPGVAAR